MLKGCAPGGPILPPDSGCWILPAFGHFLARALSRLIPKKEYGTKSKRVEMRDLFVNNADLGGENLRLILVGI